MPPLKNVISPRGQTVYSNITSVFPPRTPETAPNAALAEFAGRVVESYLSQLEHIEALAAKSAESRRAYLTAAYTK